MEQLHARGCPRAVERGALDHRGDKGKVARFRYHLCLLCHGAQLWRLRVARHQKTCVLCPLGHFDLVLHDRRMLAHVHNR